MGRAATIQNKTKRRRSELDADQVARGTNAWLGLAPDLAAAVIHPRRAALDGILFADGGVSARVQQSLRRHEDTGQAGRELTGCVPTPSEHGAGTWHRGP